MKREGALLSRNLTPPLSLGLSWPPGKFSSLLTKFLSIISDLGRAGFGLPASCSADLLFQNPIRLLSLDMMMIYRDLSLTLYIWSISRIFQFTIRGWTSNISRLQTPSVISPLTGAHVNVHHSTVQYQLTAARHFQRQRTLPTLNISNLAPLPPPSPPGILRSQTFLLQW